jgi:hypothetical protein
MPLSAAVPDFSKNGEDTPHNLSRITFSRVNFSFLYSAEAGMN